MGDDMELACLIQINAVVTGPSPVAIAIDKRNIVGQKPERGIDVQQRFKLTDQLVLRSFVEHLAEINQALPSLWFILRFDFKTTFVFFNVFAQVSQPTIARGFPFTFQREPFLLP